jgi:predicted DNA binding CopG/RHH family protein
METDKTAERNLTVAVRLNSLQMNRLKKAAARKGLPPSTFAYLAVLQLTEDVLKSFPVDQAELDIL